MCLLRMQHELLRQKVAKDAWLSCACPHALASTALPWLSRDRPQAAQRQRANQRDPGLDVAMCSPYFWCILASSLRGAHVCCCRVSCSTALLWPTGTLTSVSMCIQPTLTSGNMQALAANALHCPLTAYGNK